VSDDRQRIDKWLWHARIVRTRSAAAALAVSGHVRLNGARIEAASKAVKAGDVVTIALDARVRVLKVTGFALRRGGAEEGRALYENMAPAEPAAPPRAPEPAGGRPGPGPGRPPQHRGPARAAVSPHPPNLFLPCAFGMAPCLGRSHALAPAPADRSAESSPHDLRRHRKLH